MRRPVPAAPRRLLPGRGRCFGPSRSSRRKNTGSRATLPAPNALVLAVKFGLFAHLFTRFLQNWGSWEQECPNRGAISAGQVRKSSLSRQQDPCPESLSRLSPAPGLNTLTLLEMDAPLGTPFPHAQYTSRRAGCQARHGGAEASNHPRDLCNISLIFAILLCIIKRGR